MNSIRFSYLGILFLFVAFLSGCGEGNSGTSGSSATLEASQTCIDCHAEANDPVVLNAKITEEWKSSKHRSEIIGAGCIDCHEPQVGHPNVCSRCHGSAPTAFNTNGTDVVLNPDTERKCYKCHGAKTLSSGHFTNNTSANAPGSFVSLNYTNKCRACHNPHDVTALMSINKDWAKSGHGDPNGLAWANRDFKQSASCIRCHTATGYINYATGAETAFPATTWASASDKTKEVLACNACHGSYDFKNSKRIVGAFTAPYGGNTASPGGVPQSFPDVGASNLCVSCHAGRENGASLILGVADFANASFKDPHYLGAAAVFYGKGGFQFYTSGVRYNTYGAAGKAGKTANWSHGRLGMDNYITSTNATVVSSGAIIDSGNRGQCIACHMGPKSTHTFGAVETANDTLGASSYTRGCYGCHTGTDIDMTAFVEEEKEIWNRMFDFFAWNFAYNANGTNRTNPIYTSDAAPYFFSNALKTAALENWTLPVPGGTGAQTMGAAMNYILLTAEKGSFAHNRAFGRALIADSIIYLQNGSVGDYRAKNTNSENAIINFTSYSTARPTSYPGQVGPNISITTLKSYLVRGINAAGVRTPPYTRR